MMELTKEEESALNGEQGETLQLAYRILAAIGEATEAEKLVPIQWAHLSGVNYNTIGDAGEEFLSKLSKDAKFKVKTTVNPMGFDFDTVSKYGLADEFIKKQQSIQKSYETMGAVLSFSCIPYEIFDLPPKGTHVAFAETNAAIYANSIANLKTNKESSFSALASALTGKSPYSDLRKEDSSPSLTVRMKVDERDELSFGLLGYFAGKVADNSVTISGVKQPDKRHCKSLCAGMGTSGTCGKFEFGDSGTNTVDFDKKEKQQTYDELNTTEKGDLIALGSPQLGLEELGDLSNMLKGRKFSKRCMIFCPRAVQEQARKLGHTNEIEHAGGEILSDCCICLTPLISKQNVDGVITNSVKGAYYLKNSNKVDVNLKSLKQIVDEETK